MPPITTTAILLSGDKFFRDKDPLSVMRLEQNNNNLHCHNFHELVIVLSGRGIHRSGNNVWQLGSGDVFLIRPGEAHAYSNVKHLHLVNILYQPQLLKLPLYDLKDLPGFHAFFSLEPTLRQQEGFHKHLQVNKTKLKFLEQCCSQLEEILNSRIPGRMFRAVNIFMQLLIAISECGQAFSGEDTSQHYIPLWQQSHLFSELEQKWQQEIHLGNLAKKYGMSSSTLYRHFLKVCGISPQEYLQEIRISRACELLRDSELAIGQIATLCGFQDSNYFSRCFKRRMGTSPGNYRKQFNS